MSTAESGVDLYALRARVAPATLAAAPALSLGVTALPLLPGAQKLWALVAVGVTTYAALVARRAGNRVQPMLWDAWGGVPTTVRLRFLTAGSTLEVSRRHANVERVLGGGLVLPDAQTEALDPAAADAEYEAAMKRLIARLRNQPEHRLLNIENKNFGYARNLLGLRPLGRCCALATLLLTLGSTAALSWRSGWEAALPLALPLVVSVVALMLWRLVDPDFVRPAAEAYADRVVDALETLSRQEL